MNFSAGNHTGCHIEHQGWALGRGGAEGDGVGRKTTSRSAEGCGPATAAVEHQEADAILVRGVRRIITQATDVTGLMDGDGAERVFLCAIDGPLHRLVAEDDAEALVGVDGHRGGRLTDDLVVPRGLDAARMDAAHITRCANNTVGVVARQVRVDEMIHRDLGLILG